MHSKFPFMKRSKRRTRGEKKRQFICSAFQFGAAQLLSASAPRRILIKFYGTKLSGGVPLLPESRGRKSPSDEEDLRNNAARSAT